jgi:hypothetical protein
MKKMLAAVALCAVCAAPALWADAIVGLMSSKDVISYNYLFPKNKKEGGKLEVSLDYAWDLCDKHYENLAPLEGSTTDIDTEVEWLYASYICPGVITSRPVQAAQILPKNHDSDVKVAALMYQNLQLATFLRSSNASAYAALFNEFCKDNEVNKAEVKTYFDRNIGALIAAEVDAQFNRVDFNIDTDLSYEKDGRRYRIVYNGTLFRDSRTNRYTLEFYGVQSDLVYWNLPIGNSGAWWDERKKLEAPTVDALLTAMRNERWNNKSVFSQASIDTVRAQAALMPAVKLAPKEIAAIRDVLIAFYLAPTQVRYDALRDLHAIYSSLEVLSKTDKQAYRYVDIAYMAVVGQNDALVRKIATDVHNNPNIVTNLAPGSPRNAESLAEKVR